MPKENWLVVIIIEGGNMKKVKTMYDVYADLFGYGKYAGGISEEGKRMAINSMPNIVIPCNICGCEMTPRIEFPHKVPSTGRWIAPYKAWARITCGKIDCEIKQDWGLGHRSYKLRWIAVSKIKYIWRCIWNKSKTQKYIWELYEWKFGQGYRVIDIKMLKYSNIPKVFVEGIK